MIRSYALATAAGIATLTSINAVADADGTQVAHDLRGRSHEPSDVPGLNE